MSDLTATKKQMGQAVKSQFQALKVPGEVSKKVSAPQMRLEAKLKSGADVAIGCAEVTRGRPKGHFGLYWMLSMTGGPIQETREATGLDKDPNAARPYVLTTTSHNLPGPSHFEVGPTSDFDAVATTICDDIREQAFPIIEGLELKPERGLDFVLQTPGAVSLPFTTAVILMHLSRQTNRLDEIIKVASTKQGFYDFKGADDARARIVQPVAKWFASQK